MLFSSYEFLFGFLPVTWTVPALLRAGVLGAIRRPLQSTAGARVAGGAEVWATGQGAARAVAYAFSSPSLPKAYE